MVRSLKSRFEPRAPRVNLAGVVSVSIHLENGRQISGKLQTLSVTGGLLDVATYLDERTNFSLLFRFGGGIVQARAQMLFPMRGGMGYLQPFRFTSLSIKEHQLISAEVTKLLKQNIVPQSNKILGARPPNTFLDTF